MEPRGVPGVLEIGRRSNRIGVEIMEIRARPKMVFLFCKNLED